MNRAALSSKSLALVFLVFVSFFSGCNSFNHDWDAALNNPAPNSALIGPWQGMWRSAANGHSGKLRCLVTSKENGTYRARFHARYGKLLSFSYAVNLKAEPADNGFDFSGQANLGILAGGVYYYDGHASQTNFISTYSCKYDHGKFEMNRP